jgi:hypothetical protein
MKNTYLLLFVSSYLCVQLYYVDIYYSDLKVYRNAVCLKLALS